MSTIKYTLTILGLAAFLAMHAKGEMIDFHFGADTSTGAAAVGTAGDLWNAANTTNGGPVLLKDTTGAATSISATWTSGAAWAVTAPIYTSTMGTPMDVATSWLMRSTAASYSYSPGATNLVLTLSGLTPSHSYSLVLYGAGNLTHEGTAFTVTGASTYTGSTSGVDRRISSGPGDAYVVIPVVSSPAGTLKVTTAQNTAGYAVLNGFQLQVGQATATAAAVTNTTAATATPMIWGVNGHPDWVDYKSWIPANVTSQMGYLNQLGAGYYRITFEGAEYPSYLDTLAPKAQTAGITLLPDLPINFVATESAQTNYNNAYQMAYSFASYAISKGYNIPAWELSNEPENDGLVSIVGDGSSPADFPDAVPGGFVSIASSLCGGYQGIHDAYTAGRASKLTTITPEVLTGACYRHWGFLSKLQTYNNGVLPCDAISWHWYGPAYGTFDAAINDTTSVSNGLTPAQCLNAFKSRTNPTQPMDIWITETNRIQNIGNELQLDGSVAANATPGTSQDWASEATAIQQSIDGIKTTPSVKAIFVYELLDEPLADASSTALLASQGYFGLVTGYNGTLKNAFYTYQAEIKASTTAQASLVNSK